MTQHNKRYPTVTLDQEFRTGVAGLFELGVSHEVIPRVLGVATSLEALAGLESLIPRRCSYLVDSRCWLLAGCLSSPPCGSDPSRALFFKWPPL